MRPYCLLLLKKKHLFMNLFTFLIIYLYECVHEITETSNRALVLKKVTKIVTKIQQKTKSRPYVLVTVNKVKS